MRTHCIGQTPTHVDATTAQSRKLFISWPLPSAVSDPLVDKSVPGAVTGREIAAANELSSARRAQRFPRFEERL